MYAGAQLINKCISPQLLLIVSVARTTPDDRKIPIPQHIQMYAVTY